MMNSVSSNDLSISTTLLENENPQLCNNNYIPLQILLFSFIFSILIFCIYYTYFM